MLDLDKLKEVTNKIKQQEVRQIYFKNDKVKCNVNADEGEKLFLSIPNSEGWKIKRNDKIIDAEELGDCLITIPLEKGENEIVLEYRVPGLEIGIIITVVGIVLIFLIRYKQKKEQIY